MISWPRPELVSVSGDSTTLHSFAYDAFSRRIEKTVTMDGTTTTTSYVYDGEDIILQQTSTGTAHFVHGPGIDEPLAMVTNGTSYFYHADGLGSIVAISNSSQTVVQRYSYDTFGMVSASDATFANSYAFTGREWDKELGLYYYRARYYDPMDGRFIAKDPIGFAGGDVNVYGYVGNQPVNYVDPSGLQDKWYGMDDKSFKDWVHQIKQKAKRAGNQNYTKHDLRELYDEWNEIGRPRGKGGKSGKGGQYRGRGGKFLAFYPYFSIAVDMYEADKLAKECGVSPWEMFLQLQGIVPRNCHSCEDPLGWK